MPRVKKGEYNRIKKKLLLNIFTLMFFIIILSGLVLAGGNKAVWTYVNKPNGDPAEGANATYRVFLEGDTGGFPESEQCYCVSYPGETASDGSMVDDLRNLKYESTCAFGGREKGDSCGLHWSEGDPIWILADGSTMDPPLGTGNVSDTIDAFGTQKLDNITLSSGPNNPPNIDSVSPGSGNWYNESSSQGISVEVNTNEDSTCRWSKSPMDYSSKPYDFTGTQLTHNYILDLWQENANNIYITCQDSEGANSDEYHLILNKDTTSPVTDDDYSYNGGWYNQNAIINLNEQDSGSGVDTTYYCIDDSDTCSPSQIYSDSVNISDEGTSYLRYYSIDNVGNIQETQSVEVKIEKNAPITETNFTNNNTWVNTTQYVWLNYTDSGNVSGKDWTKYCTDAGCDPSSGTDYTSQVEFSSDQETSFRYASKDNAGNIETTNELIIKIDKTPPTTSDDYTHDGSWYNDNADITLNENCDISGCEWTKYCTGEECNPNTDYTGETIDFSENGTLRYYSKDNAGNIQDVRETTILIDKKAPDINDDYAYDDFWINHSTGTITLTPSDAGGSGLENDPDAVKICGGDGCDPESTSGINSPYELDYSSEQETVYRYQSYDKAGSGSEIGNFTVKIDKTPPNTYDDYAYNDTWNNKNASINLIESDLPDPANSGINITYYCTTDNLNDSCVLETKYIGEKINFFESGVLRYYSKDNAGNTQNAKEAIIKIDKQNISIANASVLIENGSTYSTETTLHFDYFGFEDQAQLSGIDGYYYNFSNNEGTTSGSWDTDQNGVLSGASQGNVSVYVWGKDKAGNIGPAVSDSIIVDSVNPVFSNWNNSQIKMSDSGPMNINVTITDETSGVKGMPSIRYKYGEDSWSEWKNISLVSGQNYTYDIPDPNGWYDYYNENVSWQVRARDNAGNEVDSSIHTFLIGSDEPAPIVIQKKLEFLNETKDFVRYKITDKVHNTLNNTDMSDVQFGDGDIIQNITPPEDTFDIIKGEVKIKENNVKIEKDSKNKNHTFETAYAEWNGHTYRSVIHEVVIPGYGGPFDIGVDTPPSVKPSDDVRGDINLINMNLDIGKDVEVNYWITDTENNVINGLEGQKMVFAGSLENTSTFGKLNSPSIEGNYRFWAAVTWADGHNASAFDSFKVESGGDEGGGGGGSAGGIIGSVVEEPEKETEKKKYFEFDISLPLKRIERNEILSILTGIENLEHNTSREVSIDYTIVDENNNSIINEGETKTVNISKCFSKNILITNQTEIGEYTVIAELNYGDFSTISRATFEIVPEKTKNVIKESKNVSCCLWCIISVILLLIIIIYYLWRINRNNNQMDDSEIKEILKESISEVKSKIDQIKPNKQILERMLLIEKEGKNRKNMKKTLKKYMQESIYTKHNKKIEIICLIAIIAFIILGFILFCLRPETLCIGEIIWN